MYVLLQQKNVMYVYNKYLKKSKSGASLVDVLDEPRSFCGR